MRILRKTARITGIIFWSIFAILLSLPASCRKRKWDAVKDMTEKTSFWCRGLLKICNIKLHIHGDPELAKGALIVSNHTGYVDILTHAAAFPIRFAPKAELKNAFLFGFIASLSHPVWVDRKNRMNSGRCADEFLATLEHKIPLLVYPEGTTGNGKTLLPFKTGSFAPAVKGAYPILPVLTFYTVPEGESDPGWFDDTEMLFHIWKFLGISRIKADLYILPPIHPENMDRKTFAEFVHNEMDKTHKKLLEEKYKA